MMHLADIEDLERFLCNWYGLAEIGLQSELPHISHTVSKPLIDAWTKLGRLCVGYELWLRDGEEAPLACQDGFIAPGFSFKKNGFVHVILENQGNWTMGYAETDMTDDPNMYSDFLEMPIGGTGYVPMGCKLSELIITSILTETVLFGSVESDIAERCSKDCTKELWTGCYYNALGYGAEYEKPSHQIRTNAEGSKLALFWGDEFSGFSAKASIGQERLGTLLKF